MFSNKCHTFEVLYSCRTVCVAVCQNKYNKYPAHSSFVQIPHEGQIIQSFHPFQLKIPFYNIIAT